MPEQPKHDPSQEQDDVAEWIKEKGSGLDSREDLGIEPQDEVADWAQKQARVHESRGKVRYRKATDKARREQQEQIETPGPKASAPDQQQAAYDKAIEAERRLQLGMGSETQRLYGTLPEAKKGLFARIRESFSSKDAIKMLSEAISYYQEQDQVLQEADAKIAELKKQDVAAGEAVSKAERETARSSQSLKEGRDALSAAGVKGSMLDRAQAKIDEERADLKIALGKHREHQAKVFKQLLQAENSRERFVGARKKARSELDAAAIRAVNANAEDAEHLENDIQKIQGRVQENQGVRQELNSRIAELQKIADTATESSTVEDLLQKAMDQAKDLAKQQDALQAENQQLDSSLTKHEEINGTIVSVLSREKIAALLRDEKNYWIAPLLTKEQMQATDKATIVRLVDSPHVSNKLLFPKLDQAGLIDELRADGIIKRSREELVAKGLLKEAVVEKPDKAGRAKADKYTRKKAKPIVRPLGRGRREQRFGGKFDRKLSDIIEEWNEENPEMEIKGIPKELQEQKFSNSNAKVEILRLAKNQHSDKEREVYKGADKFFLALRKAEREKMMPKKERNKFEMPKTDMLVRWKRRFSKTEFEIDLEDDFNDDSFEDNEVADIVYDQTVATIGNKKMHDRAAGKLNKVLAEIFGTERAGEIAELMESGNRDEFSSVVESWNEENPELKLTEIPRELQERKLSDASAKVEIVKLAEKEHNVGHVDLYKSVNAFIEKRKEAAAAEAAAA